MSPVSARDALEYASDDEMLKLYGVLVVGWVLSFAGQFVLQTAPSGVVALIGGLVGLAGTLAVLVGVVAVVHKLLADA